MTRTIKTVSILLLLSIFAISAASSSIPTVQAYGSSQTYGCRDYGNTDLEKQVCTTMTESIRSSFASNNFAYGYVQNYYGPATAADFILTRASIAQQSYSWNTVFYVGHSGIDQLGTPQHINVYMNLHPYTPDLLDYNVWSNTGYGTHYFVFFWSCGTANYIGAADPNPPWQLAYCWTHRDGGAISSDGYGNPWGSACYIGFQYGSPALCSYDAYGGVYNYGTFVQKFYEYAVQGHQPINTALNNAAKYITGNPQATLQSLQLKQGYDVQGLWSYIRVFGNGGMTIPY